MPYQIEELVKSNYDFSQVTIPNQEKIKAQTGKPLDLPLAVSFLKRVTENFTREDAEALRADAQIARLVVLHNERNRPKQEAAAAEAQERRELEDAIEILRLMMEEETDEVEVAQYQDAVEVLELMLENL
jgi:hypothetical protein